MIPHPESVSPELLELLLVLARLEELRGAALGGGTSMALVYGHRRSMDIDFFLVDAFNSIVLQEALARSIPEIQFVNRTAGSICATTGQVKLDILHHSYPLLRRYTSLDSVQCLSLPDMAAMKVNAVTNRGSKKDFTDLLLLNENGISLSDALDLFCRKYGKAGRFLAIRSLNWFEDTIGEPDPLYLNGWTWPEVRQRMENLGKALLHDQVML
ncbi:MAG: nucleotidyl transferase AbiEii/AbiGii toxin family protein [Spirochaetota bacterium]